MSDDRDRQLAATRLTNAFGAGRHIDVDRNRGHAFNKKESRPDGKCLDPLILECQLLSGRIAEGNRIVSADILQLIDVLPPVTTAPERLVIRNLFAAVFSRAIALGRFECHSDATRAFVTWTGLSATSDAWYEDLCRMVETLTRVLVAAERSVSDDLDDQRIARALALIARRFTDANVTLNGVAATVNLSRWHLARLLKKRTGRTFTCHLRQQRISEAARLLCDTSLSVKEVAVTVGYGDSSQFGRHFKRQCGQPPSRLQTNLAKKDDQ